MYCESCHKKYLEGTLAANPDNPIPYIFEYGLIAQHITHSFMSVGKYHDEKLKDRLQAKDKEDDETLRTLAAIGTWAKT